MAFLVRRLPGKEGDPMARMKNSVKASSLTETIVAALILLITFRVTMETLGRLMVRAGSEGREIVCISALQQCCRINRDDFLSGQPEIQEYEWGELQIKREPYAYGLYQVTLRAKIREGEREIVFTYLREE